MASADFSQFVVTTANESACETSPVKVRSLSLHVPAAFTRTSSNFWTSVPFATLSVFPSLICGSCPSGQRFAYSFFQIPSHGGHPCCSAMCFVVAYVHSGLAPVRELPCWANKTAEILSPRDRIFGGTTLINAHLRIQLLIPLSPVLRCALHAGLQGRFRTVPVRASHQRLSLCNVSRPYYSLLRHVLL